MSCARIKAATHTQQFMQTLLARGKQLWRNTETRSHILNIMPVGLRSEVSLSLQRKSSFSIYTNENDYDLLQTSHSKYY